MSKKLLALGLSTVVAVSMLAGCSSAPAEAPAEEPAQTEQTEAPAEETEAPAEEAGQYEDGKYFAMEENFSKSGWKYAAILEVENGKIVSADWNGVSVDAGMNKDEVSAAGLYPMVENGGAQAPWHEQAEKAEAYLLETQDPTAINYIDDEGHTDAISGVSIHVVEFFKLAEQALAEGPKEMGPYKNGAYHAEEADFSETSGWKYTVDVTVMFGNIEAVSWNGIHKDGGDKKKVVSESGAYGMVEKGGAQAEWHEQAAKAEAYLLETQDPTAINYVDEEGHTDAISGVSIHVVEFFKLAEEALSTAK